MRTRRASLVALLAAALGFASPSSAQRPLVAGDNPPGGPAFLTADRCIACHNGLTTSAGADISIGTDWRASMMANSARDPYWQAAVRREVTDHPTAAAAIEAECSICHMPMMHATEQVTGMPGSVFAHVPVAPQVGATPAAPPPPLPRLAALAQDGVSCTLCHQITDERLGTRESFVGGFVVRGGAGSALATAGAPTIVGPFTTDAGRARVMRSATGFTPAQGAHIQRSEVCATCHTLYTHAFGPDGAVTGELPEQVPFLEWRHSAFAEEGACQSCHMPLAEPGSPVASVLPLARDSVSRHVFRGGNFLVLRMLGRYAAELGVVAPAADLEQTALRTVEHLASSAARLALDDVHIEGGRLHATVVVTNLAGHKLPTAYPSRRAWLHVTVRDAGGTVLFESGALRPDGAIAGNDNDEDGARWEPHWTRIESPSQVQIYEPILGDPQGRATTGLLTATQYVKDNRLLPRGFDKSTAAADIAVAGAALDDADFGAGGDRIEYVVDASRARGTVTVVAELLYQPIGFRWASSLRGYDAMEPRRFTGYYDALAAESAVPLARASASTN